MVLMYKVLNLTGIDCTHTMTSKMFQIAVIITSTVSNPIAFRRKSQARKIRQLNLEGIYELKVCVW